MDTLSKKSDAQKVIDTLGGIRTTAEAIGVDRSVVNKWVMPKEKGGTGGRVPAKHWPRLIEVEPELRHVFLPEPMAEAS